MTSRERWTVYPLLILSIGMGLRSRLTSLEEVKAVRCESLTVTGRDGQPVVRLGTSTTSQVLMEILSAGRPVLALSVSTDGKSGLVEVCGADGRPQLVIGANKSGGSLAAWKRDHKLLLAAGFEEDGAGMFLINPATDQRAAVPFVPLVHPPTTAKPSTKPAPPLTTPIDPNQLKKSPSEPADKPE